MLIYMSTRAIQSGSRSSKQFFRVVGEDLKTHRKVAQMKELEARVAWPKNGTEMHRSKARPVILVPTDKIGELDRFDPVIVREEYLPILVLRIRKELYRERSGVGLPPLIERWFTNEIRGKLIQLIRGPGIDYDTSDSRLENLNYQLQKIDLGRRSDLKHGLSEETAAQTQRYARGYATRIGQNEPVEAEEIRHERAPEATPEQRRAFKDYLHKQA